MAEPDTPSAASGPKLLDQLRARNRAKHHCGMLGPEITAVEVLEEVEPVDQPHPPTKADAPVPRPPGPYPKWVSSRSCGTVHPTSRLLVICRLTTKVSGGLACSAAKG